MQDVWCAHLGARSSPKAGEIADILRMRCGVLVRPHCGDFPPGPGLLFVDAADSLVCDFLREASRGGRTRVIVLLGGRDSVDNDDLWRLLSAGACDVLVWSRCHAPIDEIVSRLERWDLVDQLVSAPVVQNNLVGDSPDWLKLLRQVVEIARFAQASVLITGETGTGKELMARLFHTLDPHRAKRELVVVDCTTIMPELSGSEFFGHERGAFTSAVAARDGAFALCDGGTLFLDEVGELPPALQPQLLRVVQERTYRRVGGNRWRNANFRLICATNRDLRQSVGEGTFRSDLYYRLAGCVVHIPPLRQRPEDIMPLACHFLNQLHPQRQLYFDEAVGQYLMRRSYPGNVRDLKQLITRIAARHVGAGPITVGDIPEEERPISSSETDSGAGGSIERCVRRALALGMGMKDIGRATAEMAVRVAVTNAQGNLQQAARALRVTDRALQMRCRAQRAKFLVSDALTTLLMYSLIDDFVMV
jgi:transcriptional regulator with GAF, ATPase, and Fis domain